MKQQTDYPEIRPGGHWDHPKADLHCLMMQDGNLGMFNQNTGLERGSD